MVIDIRNKKGDTATTALVWLIVGVFVIAIVVLQVTGAYDFIGKLFKTVDISDLQLIVNSCKVAVAIGNSIDFCDYRLVDVRGNDELVNCVDTRIKNALILEGTDVKKMNCEDANGTAKKNACNDLAFGKSDTKINGEATSTCKDYPTPTPAKLG